MKNPYGKTVKPEAAHFTLSQGDWKWQVLKLWQGPAKSLSDPYARAFCAVTSPHTFGSADLGDVYVRDIPGLRQAILSANIVKA